MRMIKKRQQMTEWPACSRVLRASSIFSDGGSFPTYSNSIDGLVKTSVTLLRANGQETARQDADSLIAGCPEQIRPGKVFS
jgi:hypothetical protein